MDQVFLDAIALFSAAYRVETSLRTLFTLSRAWQVMSDYALEEAKRNLSSEQQQAELEQLCHSVEVVSVVPAPARVFDLGETPRERPSNSVGGGHYSGPGRSRRIAT